LGNNYKRIKTSWQKKTISRIKIQGPSEKDKASKKKKYRQKKHRGGPHQNCWASVGGKRKGGASERAKKRKGENQRRGWVPAHCNSLASDGAKKAIRQNGGGLGQTVNVATETKKGKNWISLWGKGELKVGAERGLKLATERSKKTERGGDSGANQKRRGHGKGKRTEHPV